MIKITRKHILLIPVLLLAVAGAGYSGWKSATDDARRYWQPGEQAMEGEPGAQAGNDPAARQFSPHIQQDLQEMLEKASPRQVEALSPREKDDGPAEPADTAMEGLAPGGIRITPVDPESLSPSEREAVRRVRERAGERAMGMPERGHIPSEEDPEAMRHLDGISPHDRQVLMQQLDEMPPDERKGLMRRLEEMHPMERRELVISLESMPNEERGGFLRGSAGGGPVDSGQGDGESPGE
jgi:hypothetical protein